MPIGIHFFLCVLVFLIGGCFDQKEPREYREFSKPPEAGIHLQSASDGAHHEIFDLPKVARVEPAVAVSSDKLKLHIDDVWSKQSPVWYKAPLAQMSISTFKPTMEDTGVRVTFTVLSGSGGGTKENVTRWIRQLSHLVVSEARIASFVSELETRTSSSGLSFTLVDLTSFGSRESETSMLACVIYLGDQTLFIKLSGALSELKDLKDIFIAKANATAEIKTQDENQ